MSQVTDGRQGRLSKLRAIEKNRRSKVIAYVCSDRPGASANIGDDAVRPMFDHVRRIGRVERLDLFLYSRGGAVEVPWRIVNMLREHCDRLGVIIPYRAHSAATLIALGCDEIVMGLKAELGPIDPALNRVAPQEGGTPVQEEIRVEDVMSFVAFLRDKAGLGDQAALTQNVHLLAEKLSPWVLGSIYRTHSHIRMIARKLLATHKTRMEDQRVAIIVDALAEKTYLHGHAIARAEARELGLPVVDPDAELEVAMWDLLEGYEQEMEMRQPVDPEAVLGDDVDEGALPVTIAMTESEKLLSAFGGVLRLKRIRQMPQQVQVGLNVNLQLPAGVDPGLVPQQLVSQLLQKLQAEAPRQVMEQARRQSPILRLEARMTSGYWRIVDPVPAQAPV